MSSEMESRKNKQAEIRKAATLYAKSSGSLVPPIKVGQRRKQSMDTSQTSKKVQGPTILLN